MPDDATRPERRRVDDPSIDNLRRETDYRFEAVTQRFVAQEQAVLTAMGVAKEALLEAKLAQEKRYDTLNAKIDNLTTYMDSLSGREQGVQSMIAKSIAVATFVLSVVVFLVNYGFK